MPENLTNVAVFFFLSVGAVALFTFIAVAHWATQRREEREVQYRCELLKKLAEQPGEGARQVLDMLRAEEAKKEREHRQGLILGGLITFVVGVGVMLLLYGVEKSEPVWLVGLIPLLIGAVLFL